jgi:hypothetical protein
MGREKTNWKSKKETVITGGFSGLASSASPDHGTWEKLLLLLLVKYHSIMVSLLEVFNNNAFFARPDLWTRIRH